MFGLGIFQNLLSSCPFFMSTLIQCLAFFSKSLFSKIQNLIFFKTEFGLFQLQAPGNPGHRHSGGRGLVGSINILNSEASNWVGDKFIIQISRGGQLAKKNKSRPGERGDLFSNLPHPSSSSSSKATEHDKSVEKIHSPSRIFFL